MRTHAMLFIVQQGQLEDLITAVKQLPGSVVGEHEEDQRYRDGFFVAYQGLGVHIWPQEKKPDLELQAPPDAKRVRILSSPSRLAFNYNGVQYYIHPEPLSNGGNWQHMGLLGSMQ